MSDLKFHISLLDRITRTILLYFYFKITFLTISSFCYEVINLNDLIKDKFYDKKITNIHFCQWHFFNSSSASDYDIIQFNYFDAKNSKENLNYFNNLFKDKISYDKEFELFCSQITYCGVFYVNFIFNKFLKIL